MTTVFNIVSQDTTRCKSPKANIRESVIGPMCLRIRSVNTNLVTRVCITLVQWSVIARSAGQGSRGLWKRDCVDTNCMRTIEMIIPKLVIVSLKRKREATPVLPVILKSPLSSRTLYIKYHSWSFLLVMVKIFTKTFLIFVHCGRIPFYELHPITSSFALSIIIPPLRSVFTRFPFSESFVWSTCVTKSISLFVWLIFRLMVRDLCASWRNIESYTILESYQYLFIKTRLFTL